jgi:hypothetical protein
MHRFISLFRFVELKLISAVLLFTLLTAKKGLRNLMSLTEK